MDQAMLYPRSDLTTLRACPAGRGRIGEHRSNGEHGEPGRRLGEDVSQAQQSRPAGTHQAAPLLGAAVANAGEVCHGDGVPIDAPHAHAPVERMERKLIAQGERAVEMHAGAAQVDCRRRLVLKLAVRPHRPLCADRPQRIAPHRRSEWRLGTTAPLAQIGQRLPVPAPRFDDACGEQIAGSGRCGLPDRQRRQFEVAGFDHDRGYRRRRRQLRGMRAPGHLSRLVEVLRALDVVAYRVGARGAGDTDVAAGFRDSPNLAFLPQPKSRISSEGFL
jgi:hypothetical protein